MMGASIEVGGEVGGEPGADMVACRLDDAPAALIGGGAGLLAIRRG
jgi:hypothetical protein